MSPEAPEAPRDPARVPGPASALGRYQRVDDVSEGATRLVEVRLLGVPVRLAYASREHHDDLLREYRLLALAGDLERHDAPARLVRLVQLLGSAYGATSDRRDDDLDQALVAGRTTIDQVSQVPAGSLRSVRALRGLMAESDRFSEQAQLLTLPRPPLVRRFGDWWLGEFEAQLAGGTPTRWDGPLDA